MIVYNLKLQEAKWLVSIICKESNHLVRAVGSWFKKGDKLFFNALWPGGYSLWTLHHCLAAFCPMLEQLLRSKGEELSALRARFRVITPGVCVLPAGCAKGTSIPFAAQHFAKQQQQRQQWWGSWGQQGALQGNQQGQAGQGSTTPTSACGDFDCCVEIKHDGERVQVHIDGDRLWMFSKNGRDSTSDRALVVPALLAALGSGAGRVQSAILEGELLVYDSKEGAIQPWGTIQSFKPQYQKNMSAYRQQHQHLMLMFYDCIFLNGADIRSLPLRERQQKLRQAIQHPRDHHIEVNATRELRLPADNATLEAWFLQALAENREGLVVKNLDAPYCPGYDSQWVKLKADYIPGLGDLLDACVVGGCLGTGPRGAKLSRLLVAVPIRDLSPLACARRKRQLAGIAATLSQPPARSGPSPPLLPSSSGAQSSSPSPTGHQADSLVDHPVLKATSRGRENSLRSALLKGYASLAAADPAGFLRSCDERERQLMSAPLYQCLFHVDCGFTDAEWDQLHQLLVDGTRGVPPTFVRKGRGDPLPAWLLPCRGRQVDMSLDYVLGDPLKAVVLELQGSGFVHNVGGAPRHLLRYPRVHRVRTDCRPQDVDTYDKYAACAEMATRCHVAGDRGFDRWHARTQACISRAHHVAKGTRPNRLPDETVAQLARMLDGEDDGEDEKDGGCFAAGHGMSHQGGQVEPSGRGLKGEDSGTSEEGETCADSGDSSDSGNSVGISRAGDDGADTGASVQKADGTAGPADKKKLIPGRTACMENQALHGRGGVDGMVKGSPAHPALSWGTSSSASLGTENWLPHARGREVAGEQQPQGRQPLKPLQERQLLPEACIIRPLLEHCQKQPSVLGDGKENEGPGCMAKGSRGKGASDPSDGSLEPQRQVTSPCRPTVGAAFTPLDDLRAGRDEPAHGCTQSTARVPSGETTPGGPVGAASPTYPAPPGQGNAHERTASSTPGCTSSLAVGSNHLPVVAGDREEESGVVGMPTPAASKKRGAAAADVLMPSLKWPSLRDVVGEDAFQPAKMRCLVDHHVPPDERKRVAELLCRMGAHVVTDGGPENSGLHNDCTPHPDTGDDLSAQDGPGEMGEAGASVEYRRGRACVVPQQPAGSITHVFLPAMSSKRHIHALRRAARCLVHPQANNTSNWHNKVLFYEARVVERLLELENEEQVVQGQAARQNTGASSAELPNSWIQESCTSPAHGHTDVILAAANMQKDRQAKGVIHGPNLRQKIWEEHFVWSSEFSAGHVP
eukprot:jgi/Mesvir1/22695/Mv14112-RA.3